MPKQKRNHFIAQGTIRFWAQPNGQVILWETGKNSPLELRNPKSVFYGDYLYARWDHTDKRDMSAEKFLQKDLDDHIPSLVESLLSKWPDILPLSNEDKELFQKFFIRSILRHPSMYGLLKSKSLTFKIHEFLMMAKRWLDRNGEEDQAYNRLGKDRVLEGEFRHAIATTKIEKFTDQISKMHMGFIVVEEGAPNLVLGSQPFLLNPFGANHDLRMGLVIHPRIMIGLFPEGSGDFIINFSQEQVDRVNGYFVRQSAQVVMVQPQDVEGAWYGEYRGDELINRHVVTIK